VHEKMNTAAIREEQKSETPFAMSQYHMRGLALGQQWYCDIETVSNGTAWQGGGAKLPFVLLLKMTHIASAAGSFRHVRMACERDVRTRARYLKV
jgi:hypothetical protein